MDRRIFLSLLVTCASACASSGNAPTEALAPVPVFDSAEDVPCQYEVIRTVRGESPASAGGSLAVFERERVRVLGREGARIGADAVLVESMDGAVGVQRRVVGSAAAGGPAPNLQFEGEALRYVGDTCGGAR